MPWPISVIQLFSTGIKEISIDKRQKYNDHYNHSHACTSQFKYNEYSSTHAVNYWNCPHENIHFHTVGNEPKAKRIRSSKTIHLSIHVLGSIRACQTDQKVMKIN